MQSTSAHFCVGLCACAPLCGAHAGAAAAEGSRRKFVPLRKRSGAACFSRFRFPAAAEETAIYHHIARLAQRWGGRQSPAPASAGARKGGGCLRQPPPRRRTPCGGKFSQYILHSDFLRLKPALFVKPHSPFVTAPHIQRNIVAAAFLCKIQHILVQRPANMLSSCVLVNT